MRSARGLYLKNEKSDGEQVLPSLWGTGKNSTFYCVCRSTQRPKVVSLFLFSLAGINYAHVS